MTDRVTFSSWPLREPPLSRNVPPAPREAPAGRSPARYGAIATRDTPPRGWYGAAVVSRRPPGPRSGSIVRLNRG